MKASDFNPKMQEQIRRQLNENNGKTPSPVLERPAGNEPLEAFKNKDRHPARLAVIVTSFRRRLLDEDNLAEKYHIDALRYAGIIPNDSPDKISIKAQQEKVCSKADERTEIEIIPL